MDAGLVGGIIGGIAGVAGGAVGTYFSVRNTRGPRERQFMIRMSIIAWIAVIVFVTLLMVLPRPYNHLMWIPYGVLLPLTIVKGNKRQMELRESERTS